MDVSDALRAGRAAFARREWSEAHSLLSDADEATPLGPDDLERLAASAFLIGREDAYAELWVRGHQECLRAGDVSRAARFAFWIALDLLVAGELARGGGWLARAQRLLDEADRDCPERGLLAVLAARIAMREGRPEEAHEAAQRSLGVAHRFDDPDLRVFAPLIVAQVRAAMGQAAEAAALFDEVMVAVTVGEASPIAVGVVYCAVINGCHQLFDVARAREWTAALSGWCSRQPDLVQFRGECLVHRVEVMRLSGAWTQALGEAEHACAWLTRTGERSAQLLGAAFYELAEARRVRGDLEGAEESYRQSSQYGRSPEPGLALLRLAQGRPRAAETAIRRLLEQTQSRRARVDTLAACVEIALAVHDVPAARAAAEELATLATVTRAPFLRALAAHSMGEVLLADQDARGALPVLREAWMTWQELDAPYHAARVRVQLGLACRALSDEDAATLELDSARRVFERMGARADVARVHALTRGGAPALTRREVQVIALVARGKTNRAIARELAISERTVDRHVSNILMKLSLPSRSAATGYAYEHGLVSRSG
jgi:ATP/maltotriose-dependent transcriptional regulator MalT